MNPGVVILTGPPGAGKTSLARRLAAGSEDPAVHLVCDQFFDAVRSGFIAPWLPQSHAQNRTVIAATAAAAVSYAKGGYRVFVDGIVGPWFLDIFRDAAREAGVALDYVVLRADRDLVVARARDRSESPLVDYPPNIFEGFAELGPLETSVVELGDDPLETVAAAVRAGLADERFRLV